VNHNDRLSVASKLRALNAESDLLAESLIPGDPLPIVAHADRVHTLAAELLALVVSMVRQPGELPFVGGNVVVDEAAAAKDKESQRVMASEHNERADRLEKGAA
jgi:hypothetical protein